MKTLHIASILTFSALVAFACSDDDDAGPSDVGAGGDGQTAGSSGSAGKGSGGSSAGKGGSGGSAGKGGSSNGGSAAQQGGAGGEAPIAGAGGSATAGGDNAGGAAGQAGAAPVECDDGSAGGAGGAGGAGPGEGLEILGTWKEEAFDGNLVITSTSWNDSIIKAYDNATNVVYTQTPCDSMYFPGAFSKYVYTEPTANSFYYCTIIYDAKTLAEAQASAKTADEGNLDTGCDGFSWSKVITP